jgi:hypothetical protein
MSLSIGEKERRGYPHWACFCSLFGGTGSLTRKGEGSDRLLVSFSSGARLFPRQFSAKRGLGCIRENMFRVREPSQWSRCHQDELHAPGLSAAL